MSGVIFGGWGWVAAAWGISLSVLLLYTILVNVRLRQERLRAQDGRR